MADPLLTLTLSLVVLLGSCLFSMLGLGGGQLYVPVFYWLGMDLKTAAIPAALLINFLTQLSATSTSLHKKLVRPARQTPVSEFPQTTSRGTG